MSERSARDAENRSAILSKIKRSLSTTADDTSRSETVHRRLAEHRAGIIPERGNVTPDEQVALFSTMMERASATVATVGSADEIPAAITSYLKSNNLPAKFRTGDDELISSVKWSEHPLLEVDRGPAQADDHVSLSAAFGAVAESGTLVLHSGSDNPTTLNFLPENHIVVVRASDVAGDYETVWSRIREKFGSGLMPRTVNMVSGPSRTGDIEQTIFLGAHGPKKLHIIILNG